MILTDEQLYELVAPRGTSMVTFGRAVERAVLEQVADEMDSDAFRYEINEKGSILALSDFKKWLRQMAKGGQV